MHALKRSLTLPQSRFLGDLLKLDSCERLAKETPLRFLEEFALAYKLNIPFNVAIVASALHRYGQVMA